MPNARAASALTRFMVIVNKVTVPLRKTLTYDQCGEIGQRRELPAHTGVAIYFCNPPSPWQRGSNENTNGLLRQTMFKGVALSYLTQYDVDAIAYQINTLPRKVPDLRSLLEVSGKIINKMKQAGSVTIH